MIKLFFNDRLLLLSDNWDYCKAEMNAISYKVTKKSEIKELIVQFLENTQWRCFILVSENIEELFDEVGCCFERLDAAGGLVQNKSGDVLMIYRNGHWDLPKGRCEPNERWESTALREVEEECSIDGLQLFRPITTTYHIYRDMYSVEEKTVLKSTHWYLMNYSGSAQPIPQAIEGIERAEWISASDIPAVLTAVYNSIREVFRAADLMNC